jgi:serine/threonine protein kinase
MTPERLRRIRGVYEAAMEMDPAAREALLERECQADADLRKEVERLLGAREHVPEWLAGPLLGPAGPVLHALSKAASGMEGRQLRGYQLVREIGRGGMGIVYLAERADGAYRKQVAIKIVHAEKNNIEILERFRREREILASLDHPNIARLIDGGSTDEGLPYFVMEFVDGQPIHRWCDERKLNVGQRLELFRGVCAAVQYAHQRLVVHRDLKPGNILVTEDGTVKLLDFGIAKLVDTSTAEDLPPTVTMVRLMTPEYASPEQAKGEAITTLTDVYSLGVVLYELLTGHRPYHLMGAAMHEIARVISEEEPTRPSDVVATTEDEAESERGKRALTPEAVSEVREGDPNRLRRRLRGDLDSILLTTLRKEPARRYSSVEAFSEDLRRHIENRPVSAREDSLWYRASRLAHRHPGGVTAGVVIGLLLAAALGTVTWGTRAALQATQGNLPGRTITAPVIALFLCCSLAVLVCFGLLTRAQSLRVAGALAGGVPVATVMLAKFTLGYSLIGWWRSRFAGEPDPMSLLSPWFFLSIVLAGAAYLLLSWRVSQRFGWTGLTVFIVALAGMFGVYDRFLWDPALNIATAGIYPLLTDAALWAVGLVLGYAVMRLVAGARTEARSQVRQAQLQR